MRQKKIKLLLMGFGNAGRAYARLLQQKKTEIMDRYGCECVVVGITTGSRGNLADESGIDLDMVLAQLEGTGSFNRDWSCFCELSGMQLVQTLDYDVLIEMTPLNIHTGQPAIDHIKGAFARGRHAITANKGPIAWQFSDLRSMAKESNVKFLYETTVMDGTPVFNLYEETLPMCRVQEVSGILNSTTNFVLVEMAQGKSYEAAIEEGKKRGFVEADPAMDIQGYDAAAKITALVNVLMDADLKPTDIDRSGIDGVTTQMLQEAEKRGKVLKLVCRGWREADAVKGEVKLREIDRNDFLASVTGTTSILSITTDLMGKLSIVEHDPEIEQTGYGVFSDTMRLIRQLKDI